MKLIIKCLVFLVLSFDFCQMIISLHCEISSLNRISNTISFEIMFQTWIHQRAVWRSMCVYLHMCVIMHKSSPPCICVFVLDSDYVIFHIYIWDSGFGFISLPQGYTFRHITSHLAKIFTVLFVWLIFNKLLFIREGAWACVFYLAKVLPSFLFDESSINCHLFVREHDHAYFT